jgi:predicted PurR-regulated permease PerM
MLVVCLAALVFVLPVVYMRNEVIATAFGAAVLIYVVYALVTDTLDRRRNPKWG